MIDVRLHTETIVSQEGDQPYVHCLCLPPSPSFSQPSSPSWVDVDPDTRQRLIHSLSSWHFEPHKLPEEEVLACSYILFEALYRIEHMYDAIPVPLSERSVLLHYAYILPSTVIAIDGVFSGPWLPLAHVIG